YLQIANIAADDTSISTDANKFAAQYNGGGFTISGGTVPMFAYLNTGAVVENVNLTAVNIDSADQYVGGIVANMTAGTVKNNQVAGTVVKSTHVTGFAGGIAGSVTAGTISGNVVTSAVNAPTAGGIAASVTAGTITGNTNDAIVTAATAGGCITAVGGTLTDNVCLKHDHKAQVTAGGDVNENTDQTYLLGALITAPTASGTVHAGIVDANDITDATDVSTSTQLIFTFNKPMDQILTQNAFSLIYDTDKVVTCEFSWATKDDDSASVLTVTPKTSGNQSVALLPNTQYTATFAAGGVDIFGQTIGGTKSWNFTTALDVNIAKVVVKSGATVIDDTTTDTTTSDRKDVANVPVNSIIEIYFTDALNAAQEAIVESTDNVKLAADDLNTADFEAVDTAIAAPVLDGTKKILTVSPSANLPYASKLVLSLANLTDANNNTLATYNYSFVTASQPVVLGHVPATDAQYALPEAPISISFSKPIDTTTVTAASFVLVKVGEGANLLDNTNVTWSEDFMTVTASPAAKLDYDTEYRVTLTTFVTDNDALLKNALIAYTYDFKTVKQTGIKSVAPVQNAVNVKIGTTDTNIVLTLEKEQAGSAPKLAIKKLLGDGVFTYVDVAETAFTTHDAGTNVYTYTLPAALPNNSVMQVTFSNLLDDNGYLIDYGFDNELSGDNTRGNFIYTFNTATQPVVITATPTSDIGETGQVDVTEPIVITFSKKMDTTDTNTLVTVTEEVADTGVAADFTANCDYVWSGGNTVLTITPKPVADETYKGVFKYSSKYVVTLAAGLKDDSALGGNAIDQRTDIDLSNAGVQTNTFTFKTKSSEAPEFSPLNVVRDRRVLTTSFTAVVNDNGAPINTAADKVGVIVQTNAVTPTSVPANQVVKATIGANGYITCVLDPDTDVKLTMD
ncbi:MAG: Ig-like domain-containing protein, partial [Bacteroidales bacterium]